MVAVISPDPVPSAAAAASPGALADELLRSAARLSRWASQSATFEVPAAQARVLALIEERTSARVGTLALADHSSQPTMTAQLSRMEAAGWVLRGPDPADARACLVSLTAAGRAALARVRHARAEALEPAIARLEGDPGLRIRATIAVIEDLLRAADTPT